VAPKSKTLPNDLNSVNREKPVDEIRIAKLKYINYNIIRWY